jgi:hypothetical protein
MLLRGACTWATSNLTGQGRCAFSAYNCSAANLTMDAQALCAVSSLVNASVLYSTDFNASICAQGACVLPFLRSAGAAACAWLALA